MRRLGRLYYGWNRGAYWTVLGIGLLITTVCAQLSIEPSEDGESIRLIVSGEAGETWNIEFADDLVNWQNLEDDSPVVLDSGGSGERVVGLTGETRYFRGSFVEVGNGLPPPFAGFSEDLEMYIDGDFMVIETTNVPNHSSPYFSESDDRYEAYNGDNADYRRNPNTISAQSFVYRIPLDPVEATNKTATSLGSIGVAINGVAFFNQYAGPDEPLTNEINSFDQYAGHPQNSGVYHYHIEPLYLTGVEGKEGLVGVLLDGFPVYGPMEDGEAVTNDDLDEYHGHFHATDEFPDGVYHYHFTDTDPYLNGGEYYGAPGSRTN